MTFEPNICMLFIKFFETVQMIKPQAYITQKQKNWQLIRILIWCPFNIFASFLTVFFCSFSFFFWKTTIDHLYFWVIYILTAYYRRKKGNVVKGFCYNFKIFLRCEKYYWKNSHSTINTKLNVCLKVYLIFLFFFCF